MNLFEVVKASTSKFDFQNKDRFENLSCSQCHPYSTTGNIVLAIE